MPPGSPLPGAWNTDRTAPWLREPMRAFADVATDYVVLLLASQLGKTEAGLNVLGWVWETDPAPAMWVTPTERLAHSMSKDRLTTMFDHTPGLWDITRKPVRPGSLERYVSGVRFGLAWAGSATELASHPCKYVIVDERSRMGEDVGGEGDPVRVVSARTKMYPGSKVGIFSSPTEEGICPTFRWWLQGTRMRWAWGCPNCGEWLFPCLSLAGYPDKASYATIRAEAWIECPECARQIRDDDRESLAMGYIPTVVDDESGTMRLAPGLDVRNSVASYWCTGFSSHVSGIGRIMEQYARAAREGEPGDVQAIVNTWAGELWKLPGEGADADNVKECQIHAIPDTDVQLITCGVDVQENSLFYVVRGWGAGSTSWLIDHDQLYGATEFADVWLALRRALEGPHLGRSPVMCLIDSGYNTAQVYEQCRLVANWSPAKGHDRSQRPLYDSTVDESPTGRALKTLRLWHYCADTWKTWLYSHIRWPRDEPGAWYVPQGVDDEYCSQVVNEKVRIYRGRRQWYTTGNRRNHYLDAEVLATVAAHINGVRTLKVVKLASGPKPPNFDQKARPRRPLDRQGL